jgi:hypothetical protein
VDRPSLTMSYAITCRFTIFTTRFCEEPLNTRSVALRVTTKQMLLDILAVAFWYTVTLVGTTQCIRNSHHVIARGLNTLSFAHFDPTPRLPQSLALDMYTNQSMATLSARGNMALDPSPLLTSSSRTSSRMSSTDPSLSSTLQIHILSSTHANLLPGAQSVHHTKTLRPLHHTRNFFLQATDPLFVPSETDIPESWRPRFDQTEKNTPARAVLFMIGFFMLAALWPVTAGLVR